MAQGWALPSLVQSCDLTEATSRDGQGKEATSSRCGYRCRLAAISEAADVPADHDLLWWWSSSKHDLHLEATNYRLKELGLQTLKAAVSVSDPDTVTALFAQFTECAYRSFELEERWLNASADTSREAHGFADGSQKPRFIQWFFHEIHSECPKRFAGGVIVLKGCTRMLQAQRVSTEYLFNPIPSNQLSHHSRLTECAPRICFELLNGRSLNQRTQNSHEHLPT